MTLLPVRPHRLLLSLAACLALVAALAAAPPADAAKFKQPGCGKLKKKIGKAKPGAAKRAARRAHKQCQANTKAYRQIRNSHFVGARADYVEIDNVYCANGKATDDDRVYRDGWRVIDAKVRAGGRKLSAVVEIALPGGGRHSQGVIRDGDVWKIGWEFGGKINAAGVVAKTNAAAACKTL